MKKRIKAIWRILTCKKYVLYTIEKDCIHRNDFEIQLHESIAIVKDLQRLNTDACHQEDALEEAKNILTGSI